MITADLKGKSAPVIGGASGIGLATVERLTACEARVAIDDLPGEKLGRKVARLHRLGREVLACPGGIDNHVNDGGTPGTATPITHLTARSGSAHSGEGLEASHRWLQGKAAVIDGARQQENEASDA